MVTEFDIFNNVCYHIHMARGDNPRRGADHPRTVLSDDDVRNIRLRAERGEPNWSIAKDFDTSRQNISMIISKRRRAGVV